MVGEVMTSLGIFKSLFDMAKGLKDINDAAVRNGAVVELLEKITTAHIQQAELVEENRKLKDEIRRFEDWETKKQRYQLADVGRGAVAYVLKPAVAGGEPPHNICANCYERAEKSFLQPETRFGSQYLVCHQCDSELIINGQRHDTPLATHPVNKRRRP